MELVLKRLSEQIIGAAIEVHRELGPGLLESVYEECLCYELAARKIPFERQKVLPVAYKWIKMDCGYRLDILVAGAVVVEIKSVEELGKIHEAQLLTYLRTGGWPLGLLINFNVIRLVDGILRRVGHSALLQNTSVSSVCSVSSVLKESAQRTPITL
jgi:GxxExxY protein